MKTGQQLQKCFEVVSPSIGLIIGEVTDTLMRESSL